MSESSQKIYLDYAASTPVDPRVLEAMAPYWSGEFGNPGSPHTYGKAAKAAVLKARMQVGNVFGMKTEEIIFTSGGTESNNLALLGTIEGIVEEGRDLSDIHIVTSDIEHSSVENCFSYLLKKGAKVSYAPVTEDGIVDLIAFKKLLTPKTALVSVVMVSNEIGVISPVKEMAEIIRAHERATDTSVYFHVDASHGLVFVPVKASDLGADLITIDGQKIYGPKGVGVLAHKTRVPLRPIMHGGSQENGLRPGTLPTPLIVGLGEAVSIAEQERNEVTSPVTALRDHFIEAIESAIPAASLNGSRKYRVANNINFSFPGISGELLALTLDQMGLMASTRSACVAGVAPGSKIVQALGKGDDSAVTSVRFTLGKNTTTEDINAAVAMVIEAVTKLSPRH